jgi:uroporphyrin-III C-methyltransferase / precorrin-2 dehydrogenase / sirohydrochlorin ferrochelatase
VTPPTEGAPVLPVGLRLAGRPVLVVGAGPVALRRVSALLDAGAQVRLVSPEAVPVLADLAERGRLQWDRRRYQPGDLEGAWLAMACTDVPEVNAAVLAEAEASRIFCLRVDDASAASAWMPATAPVGDSTTVAVHAGGDPVRAAALRDVAVAAVMHELRRGSVPARQRRAPAPSGGRVVLVGGGPGDPGLLTRRGWEALTRADVVVVDRLAPLQLLDDLPDDVLVIDVSKVPRGPFVPQERINEILVEHALAGRTVVRFKGGDPFVFGRGMEEAQACAAAGVPVEVVPGVTSAVAVPALAGVPVTHRGLSQGFTVVSGHVPPGDPRSTLDWGALARGGTTLVLLMAVHTLPDIAAELLAQGMDPATPVACVQDGGLASQQVARGRLDEAAELAGSVRPPAVVVVGAVAGLAASPA